MGFIAFIVLVVLFAFLFLVSTVNIVVRLLLSPFRRRTEQQPSEKSAEEGTQSACKGRKRRTDSKRRHPLFDPNDSEYADFEEITQPAPNGEQ